MTAQEKAIFNESFRKDGFVLLPGFLNNAEVLEVKERLTNFIQDVVPHMPPEHAFYEDKNDPASLKQLQTLYSYDEWFGDMMFNSRFQALAELLLNDKVVGKNMQYFNKPAGIGKPTPAHQDGFYFMLEPNEALTMWLGLDDVDEENGCVKYVKASHLKGLRSHARTNTLGFSQGIDDYNSTDEANEIWFATKPGDLLVHHSLTIHKAGANESRNRNRRALGFIYYAAQAKEDSERKQAYQAMLSKEIKEKVK